MLTFQRGLPYHLSLESGEEGDGQSVLRIIGRDGMPLAVSSVGRGLRDFDNGEGWRERD